MKGWDPPEHRQLPGKFDPEDVTLWAVSVKKGCTPPDRHSGHPGRNGGASTTPPALRLTALGRLAGGVYSYRFRSFLTACRKEIRSVLPLAARRPSWSSLSAYRPLPFRGTALGRAPPVREMGGAPGNPAPRNHFLGVDCQTIRPPLHRWALDKQSFHWGLKTIVECRPPLGALPLSLPKSRRPPGPRTPRRLQESNKLSPPPTSGLPREKEDTEKRRNTKDSLAAGIGGWGYVLGCWD